MQRARGWWYITLGVSGMGNMPRAVGTRVPFLGCSEQLVQGPASPRGRVVLPGQALLCQGWGHGDSHHCRVFFPAALPLWSIFFSLASFAANEWAASESALSAWFINYSSYRAITAKKLHY